ncbi:hypothetical protein diail_1780 [Diaporthe ilicicola]|nr:hypothetical protein diail_1780 [Diaporthe ilicicola]
MPPRARRRRPSPGTPVRITPLVQRGVVTLLPNSRYRVEKPKYDAPKWSRDNRGRLVSRVPRRPNVGGFGDLEAFYHVLRKNPSEVLPPQQTLWRQRYGDNHSIAYRPLWPGIAQNLVEPLRTRQDIDSDDEGDYEGAVGVPYLFAYDENGPPDEDGLFYRRWRPFEIIANGGYGVVITYVDNALNLPDDLDDVADEHKKVAKFNYRGGDLKEIMQSVVAQASISDMVRHAGRAQRRAGRAQRRAGQAQRRAAAAQQQAAWADVGVEEYSHFQPPSKTPVVEVDTADTFRQETMILEILEMTGSPHLPKIWKLADPPQDGTLCTMEYIPGARTLDEQLDTQSNWKVPIRLVWEAVFCLSKALSVMAYGSEDPAPSHRVHGWNQIVHLDWGAQNIFVQRDHPSHTCSHGPCFMVGDFGFALVVPNRAAAKAKFRLAQLQRGWHIGLNPQLPVSHRLNSWRVLSSFLIATLNRKAT